MPAPCSRCGGTIGATGHGLCAACLLRLASAPEALAPEYEIETLLGSGRSGTTYLARALASGDMLAVKIVTMREGLPDIPAIARSVGANLVGYRHAGIAMTHAIDVDPDGNLRIVRDYVPGRTLPAWLAKAGAPERQQVADRLTAALADAHSRGIAHGHIDAANIIVTTGAQPVIVDFGAHAALRALQGVGSDANDMAAEDRSALEVIRSALTAQP